MQERLLRVRDVLWCLLAAMLTVAMLDAGIIASNNISSIKSAPVSRLVAVQAYVQPITIVKPTRLTERAAPWKPVIYSVHPGDSLSAIARAKYGRAKDWPVIYWKNHKIIRYANIIFPGQLLSLPALPARIPAPPAILSPTSITVASVTHTSSDSDSDASTSSSHPDRLVAPPKLPTQHYSGTNEQIAQQMMPHFGFSVSGQFGCLYDLWMRESGWDPTAYNPGRHTTNPDGSHAFGIPQALPGYKMASAGSDWRTNPATQIRWGLGYIESVYSTPCGAWAHETADGWY